MDVRSIAEVTTMKGIFIVIQHVLLIKFFFGWHGRCVMFDG
jgi:hypothetical protein